MRILMLAVLVSLVSLVPGLALAQDPPSDEQPPIVVYGHQHRPAAFYLLTRARVRFDRVEAEHHAVDRIVESVTHAPF